MSDAQGLLDAIRERPDDDLPRLALADWCMEQPDEATQARGEFIQCAAGPPGSLRKIRAVRAGAAVAAASRAVRGSVARVAWRKAVPRLGLRPRPHRDRVGVRKPAACSTR